MKCAVHYSHSVCRTRLLIIMFLWHQVSLSQDLEDKLEVLHPPTELINS